MSFIETLPEATVNELHTYLLGLASGEMPEFDTNGICVSLGLLLFDTPINFIGRWVASVAESWEYYSGIEQYPIECADFPGCPKEAYWANVESHNMWNDDEYGNRRRELCKLLAESLSKD